MTVALVLPPLDTATVAVHLGCTPGYVRLLVAAGIITPLYRKSRTGRGRPGMWFDIHEVDRRIVEAQVSGRVQLDKGRPVLRK